MTTETNPRGAGRKVGYRKDPILSKTDAITFKCSSAERAKIKENARNAGLSVSAYILSRCLK